VNIEKLPPEDLERVVEHEPKLGELDLCLEKFFLHDFYLRINVCLNINYIIRVYECLIL
jgi:hypothetical protein